MFHHLKASEITKSASGTRTFQGSAYHAGVSFFLEEDPPGAGPKLHSHDYPETFIVEAGAVRFTVGDAEVDAGPGDIVVVEGGTPHAFVSLGPDVLEMVCIHAAETMSANWLDGR
jgi:mannose-6-phosphate isomerase-like protein (cupin superfamily)